MTAPRTVVVSRAQAAVLAELACDGASNAEIANRLGISEWTVKSHMKGLARAFDRRDRAAIVVDYLRRQVVVRVVTQPSREPA